MKKKGTLRVWMSFLCYSFLFFVVFVSNSACDCSDGTNEWQQLKPYGPLVLTQFTAAQRAFFPTSIVTP